MSQKVKLGTGLHQSKGNGNLIITLEADARIGFDVDDKNGKRLGKVFDIFGPVDKPYASIKLDKDVELGNVSGKPVFIGDAPRKPRKKRNKRERRSP